MPDRLHAPIDARIDSRILANVRLGIRIGCGLLTIVALIVLASWFLDVDSVLQPGFAVMAPPTAIGFLLCGLALSLQQAGRARPAIAVASLLLAGAAILLAARVLYHDDPLTRWLLDPARRVRGTHTVCVAGTTAFSFVLFALALLAASGPWERHGTARHRVLIVACVTGLLLNGLALLGYTYGVETLFAIDFYRGMALQTVLGFIILFAMGLAIEPEQGWLAMLFSGRPSARASRMQLVLATAVPFLIGDEMLVGQRRGTIPPGLAMAIVVLSTMLPMVIQILRDGRTLDAMATRLLAALEAQARLNADLEQRVAERTERLVRSETRLRGFVDNAVEGLALLQITPDGRLTVETASPSLRTLHGLGDFDPEESPPIERIFDPEDAADLRRNIVLCLASGRPHRYKAQRTVLGQPRLFDVILAPIAGTAEQQERLIASSVRDITDNELREEQLRQSQKMEAVGQLTGGLAHDFNNLLAGISGSLELIATRIEQGRTQDVGRYLDAAQDAGRRAAALTHRLLAFSRRQTLDPKPASIDDIVAGMEELVRRTMGPQVAVIVRPSTGDWSTLIDANQLENALLNLCLNARDAMPDGGTLTIATLDETLGADPSGLDLPPGDYVRLTVTDSGVGMTADLVARAFDPFFTTKPIGQGTGLGLSMIYGFVRQSGGCATLLSEPGHGTTVSLRLPRYRGTAPPRAASQVAEPPCATGDGRSVLVVDDEPSVRMIVVEILAERGYRTLQADDGVAGLALLRSTARIDLLVTDVGLPNGINGRQLADAARALRPGLKVLFITGYAENAVLGDGDLAPGMEVLTKPFTMNRLIDRVGALAAPVA